jgi:hypothetical protein
LVAKFLAILDMAEQREVLQAKAYKENNRYDTAT